ncbi:MAG: M28 family peptidase [Parasphingopyxis sp.]|uniref:M28 family peptidase n=1 Tax=Parasphingopyxis sp. TaxID=1920299 RepID=UPI003FA102FF
MIRRLLAACAALFLLTPAPAQTLPTEADLRRHIEILASDDFEGRQPGTAGEALAVSYIAAQLADAGLLPGYRGNYYQPVALVSRTDGSVTLRTGGARTDGGEILAMGNSERVTLEDLPLTFVGYAVDIGDEDGGAMGAARFDGQAVLLLGGAPEGAEAVPSYRTRLAFFRERGAAAIIGIVEPDIPWEAAAAGMRFRQTYLASDRRAPVEAILSAPTADAILSGIGQSRETLGAMAAAPGFRPVALDMAIGLEVETVIDRYDGINVVARLPGTGETGETVLFSAHHDHFGICRPDSDEDRICNGAVDNASGTAALIETARALAQGERPMRDILFLTTTAEEDGLLGARAFVAEPPVSLDAIVAVFNLDTIAIATAGAAVGIIGRGMTPLDTLIDAVAAENGRTIDTSTDINGFVQRNDGWAFLEQGVPAVMAGGSFTDPELLNAFLRGPYHGPDDEIADIELGGALEDTWLHIALGRAFADPARYPSPRR